MSSIRVSASGDRQANLTIGGGPFTALQVPSKPDDQVNMQVQTFGKIRLQLPAQGVTLQRFQDEGGSIIQVLVIEGVANVWQDSDGNDVASPQPCSVQVEAVPVVLEEGTSTWHPHVNVDARRYDDEKGYSLFRFIDGEDSTYNLVDGIDLAIPPTEPKEPSLEAQRSESA